MTNRSANDTMTINTYTELTDEGSDLRRALDTITHLVDADPFFCAHLARFRFACVFLLRQAHNVRTGEGRVMKIIAGRMMTRMTDIHFETADLTGNMQTVYDAAYFAAREVFASTK